MERQLPQRARFDDDDRIDKAHGITTHAGLHWEGDLRLDMASLDACNDEMIAVRLEDIEGGDGEVHLVSI